MRLAIHEYERRRAAGMDQAAMDEAQRALNQAYEEETRARMSEMEANSALRQKAEEERLAAITDPVLERSEWLPEPRAGCVGRCEICGHQLCGVFWCEETDSVGGPTWAAVCAPRTRCAEPCACCDFVDERHEAGLRDEAPEWLKSGSRARAAATCCRCVRDKLVSGRPGAQPMEPPPLSCYRTCELNSGRAKESAQQVFAQRAGDQRCVFVDEEGARCSNFGSNQAECGLLCNAHKGRAAEASRRVEVAGGGDWTCSTCTLINTGGRVCAVCGADR